jgi:hypothetical protein
MGNPAITAAIIAAAHQEEVEEKIEARLKKANAVTPASAVLLELKEKERELLGLAMAAGTVRQTAGGRLYLDELAVANRKEGQGFMALLIILVAASIIASVVALVALSAP